jgi:hypothetical protein
MRGRATAALVAAAVAAAVAPAAPAAAPPVVTLGKGRHVYRGQADRALGTLRLLRAAKLSWRHPPGGPLRLTTSAGRGRRAPLVVTSSHSGSLRLRAGTYRDLRTVTHGSWRITITVPRRP